MRNPKFVGRSFSIESPILSLMNNSLGFLKEDYREVFVFSICDFFGFKKEDYRGVDFNGATLSRRSLRN